MLRALIVDDEIPARDELRFLLSAQPGISIVGEADSGPAAISQAAQLKPDVVFLDVQMRGMSGVDTALALRAIVPGALIVFATAFDEYAMKAFEVGAVDYLLKPFEGDRVSSTVERLQKYHPEEWRQATARVHETLTTRIAVQKLPVEKNGKIVLVNYDDILYAYANIGTVVAVTEVGEAIYAGTLAK